MKPLLMGAETEYSMSGRILDRVIGPESVYDLLLAEIRAKHKWLIDVRSSLGVYLDNGSRCYLDSGAHNELCTPELRSPREVACYDRVNEKILLDARAAAMSNVSDLEICITKNNVNVTQPDEVAWGQHEAYTCWIPLKEAARRLIPHLVSRLPYAGAGCLSCHPNGIGFELSQRARHMTRRTGSETTHDRAIFCTRAWRPSDGTGTSWTRTNLISKDSQRCSFGTYLCYGVTGLLFAVLNEGHDIGRQLELKEPVRAMRQISVDPWLETKIPLTDGRRLTAVEIQRQYRDQVGPLVAKGDFPDWACEVLDDWTVTLDQLDRDPLELARRLDPYLKLAIFDHELSRAGFTWGQLRQALRILDSWRCAMTEASVCEMLAEDNSDVDAERREWYRGFTEKRRVKQLGLDVIRFAVRLQALELNYHELGGLFDHLDAAGQIDSVVIKPEEVERGRHHPPPGGRAEARSRRIRDLSGEGSWRCEWQAILNTTDGTWYDMRDPFSSNCTLSQPTDCCDILGEMI